MEKRSVTGIELISVIADCAVPGLLFAKTSAKVAEILQHAVGFNYDAKQPLFENALALARQEHFETSLRLAADAYRTFCCRAIETHDNVMAGHAQAEFSAYIQKLCYDFDVPEEVLIDVDF